jgi:hypothetical protein
VTYTVSVTNNDSAACDSSSVNLTSAIPLGWGGGFGVGSISVAPGATAGPLFGLTPPSSAVGPDNFSVGASRSSTSGTSASGMVVVASELNVTLAIASGKAYQLMSTVKLGTMAVAGATLVFTVRNSFGAVSTLTGVPDSSGTVKVTLRLRSRDPRGTYQVTASASTNGFAGTTSVGFTF